MTTRSAPPLAVVLALVLTASAGCVSQGTALAPADAAAYHDLGLSPDRIEPWEDGMRTTGGPGSYEWWYFDFTLDDGSTLVIAYYTKDFTQPQTSLAPFVTIQLESPGGANMARVVTARRGEFTAAKDRCDVRIGSSTASGDLHDYTVHVEAKDIQADLALHGTVPPWRPRTGHLVFQKDTRHYFAWLPSVPQGEARGVLTVNGARRAVTGVGYHDHNWGDVSMLDLIHDWYWGRAQVGPYTVIASYITARDEYGATPLPLFMLARDGEILAEDASRVRFSTADIFTDAYTAKPVAGTLTYDYVDGATRYRVTFHRDRDINRTRFVDLLSGGQAFLARLAGFDGAYLRFTGPVTVERMDGDSVVETATQAAAVWELMYLGHVPRGTAAR